LAVMFQSTHPRGVRLLSSMPLASSQIFQSTHPRGVRRRRQQGRPSPLGFQSTHPRGVRPLYFLMMRDFGAFQSTHPRGVRHGTWTGTVIIQMFQSTHPRGVRPAAGARRDCSGCFNPRTHEGCDKAIRSLLWRFMGFNPRTHEGCDISPSFFPRGLAMFQSTHPRGVRLCVMFAFTRAAFVSIHAPTRGATLQMS